MDIEQLGPYRIVDELGRGGMGAVYKAIHRETGEEAALKLLSPSLAHEEGFRSRFEAEIETLRKLRHPNIVRLFGFGEQDLLLFYVMELVDGSSLEQELRQGRRFDWREVTRIGIETARALRHAHDRGVIHRDIKPGNLLLATDGRVKLSDFGIARLFGYSKLTSVGNVLGTAEYMAPEQAEGRPVDARADLYSLGALMYALLARRPLFRGKSLPEMLHKQRFEQPEPIRSLVPDLPDEFERILNQLLEKDPDRRIPNADILARRLEQMQQSLSVVSETLEADPSWFHSDESPEVEPARTEVASPLNEIPVTLDIGQPLDQTPSSEEAFPASVALENGPGQDKTPPASSGPVAPPAAPAPPTGRFVVVSEDELGDSDEEDGRPPVFSWQTGVLVVSLLLVGLTMWWFLQPPTAESLYKRIKDKIADGSIDSIRLAKDDIHDFLIRFSYDHNAAELRNYERELELANLQRDFDLMNRRSTKTGALQPIEQAYSEAMNYAKLDPELGAAKLQAILDLYRDSERNSEANEQCLVLAQRRLTQLREEIKKRAAQQIDLIEKRLKAADALRKSEPERAEAMYRAVVELYSDKPWAADVVHRAHESLKKPSAKKP
jgi:eukaryotic-like serine/threonine-protein kinase